MSKKPNNTTTVGGVPVHLRRDFYYEETGTTCERLFVVFIGLISSYPLAYIFHVISSTVLVWLRTILIIGAVVFVIFHLFDALIYIVRWVFGRSSTDNNNNSRS